MFALQSVKKRFGGQVVLDEASWAPSHRGVIGLVGPNGAGKTTLLRILIGEEDIDGGQVSMPSSTTLGYLPQELDQAEAQGSIFDVLLEGRRDLLDLEERMEELRSAIEMDQGSLSDVAEHSAILERLEREGGYVFRAQARQIAAGLGFSEEDLERPIGTFSGGWRMRALLGRLLLQRPDVLLLDEPTNHLDTESLEWLESFLGRYEGLIVVVSHDRWFLNRMAVGIVELQGGKLTSYPGNYDAYRERKAEEIERLTAAAERQEREIQRIQEFIERFRYKATKARQAQSRLRSLEKIERIEVPTDEARDFVFRFPQPPRGPKIVAEMRGVAKRFGDVEVWRSLDFMLTRGEKVALMGPNGAGKTTLLKILAGVLPHDAGDVRIGENVEVGYFAQHAVEQLNPAHTVLEEMMRAADVDTSARVRTLLGTFGFSGDDVEKRVSVLSGGEKNRLALAKMMLAPAGLLLLDEPTNHLDIESRQVLEFALQDFDGTFVVVSHDRYFVNEVARRIVHLENGTATDYLGDYEYYLYKRGTEAETAAAEQPDLEKDTVSKKDARRAAADLRARKREATAALRKQVAALEARVAELEEGIAEAESRLADPSIYADEATAREWSTKYKSWTAELETTMEEWESKSAEMEEAERQVN